MIGYFFLVWAKHGLYIQREHWRKTIHHHWKHKSNFKKLHSQDTSGGAHKREQGRSTSLISSHLEQNEIGPSLGNSFSIQTWKNTSFSLPNVTQVQQITLKKQRKIRQEKYAEDEPLQNNVENIHLPETLRQGNKTSRQHQHNVAKEMLVDLKADHAQKENIKIAANYSDEGHQQIYEPILRVQGTERNLGILYEGKEGISQSEEDNIRPHVFNSYDNGIENILEGQQHNESLQDFKSKETNQQPQMFRQMSTHQSYHLVPAVGLNPNFSLVHYDPVQEKEKLGIIQDVRQEQEIQRKFQQLPGDVDGKPLKLVELAKGNQSLAIIQTTTPQNREQSNVAHTVYNNKLNQNIQLANKEYKTKHKIAAGLFGEQESIKGTMQNVIENPVNQRNVGAFSQENKQLNQTEPTSNCVKDGGNILCQPVEIPDAEEGIKHVRQKNISYIFKPNKIRWIENGKERQSPEKQEHNFHGQLLKQTKSLSDIQGTEMQNESEFKNLQLPMVKTKNVNLFQIIKQPLQKVQEVTHKNLERLGTMPEILLVGGKPGFQIPSYKEQEKGFRNNEKKIQQKTEGEWGNNTHGTVPLIMQEKLQRPAESQQQIIIKGQGSTETENKIQEQVGFEKSNSSISHKNNKLGERVKQTTKLVVGKEWYPGNKESNSKQVIDYQVDRNLAVIVGNNKSHSNGQRNMEKGLETENLKLQETDKGTASEKNPQNGIIKTQGNELTGIQEQQMVEAKQLSPKIKGMSFPNTEMQIIEGKSNRQQQLVDTKKLNSTLEADVFPHKELQTLLSTNTHTQQNTNVVEEAKNDTRSKQSFLLKTRGKGENHFRSSAGGQKHLHKTPVQVKTG